MLGWKIMNGNVFSEVYSFVFQKSFQSITKRCRAVPFSRKQWSAWELSDRSHDPGLPTIASAFTSACQTLLYRTVLYITVQCTGQYSDNKATTISSIPFQTPQGGGWEETTHSLTATHSQKPYTLVLFVNHPNSFNSGV